MDGLKNEKWMVNNFKTSSGITHESKSGQTKLYTCTVCQKVEIDQWKHAALGHGIWLLVHPMPWPLKTVLNDLKIGAG